jgi:hypothetical protein
MSSPRVRWVCLIAALFFIRPVVAADPATVDSFDAKGVKIRYVVQGTGEPVVLVHGLAANAFANWQLPGIMATLAKDHRVIALDLPGHGGSDKPEKPDAYGVQMVEDVVLLLDHLHIQKAHIVGYSLGGMITLKLMTLHPERVLSGTLGGMGWLQEGSNNQKMWDRIAEREGSGALKMVAGSMGKLAVTEDALKAIKISVSVIIGDEDPVNWMYVSPLKRVRKDWPVVEIAKAGHITCIFKKSFSDAIVAWLAKNQQK